MAALTIVSARPLASAKRKAHCLTELERMSLPLSGLSQAVSNVAAPLLLLRLGKQYIKPRPPTNRIAVVSGSMVLLVPFTHYPLSAELLVRPNLSHSDGSPEGSPVMVVQGARRINRCDGVYPKIYNKPASKSEVPEQWVSRSRTRSCCASTRVGLIRNPGAAKKLALAEVSLSAPPTCLTIMRWRTVRACCFKFSARFRCE